MTSRVQKGGSLFRPVAKARARTAGPSGDTPSSISRATEAPTSSQTPAPTQQTQTHTQLPPPQTPTFSQSISIDLGKEAATPTPNRPPAIRKSAAPPPIASSSRATTNPGPRAPTIGRSTPGPVASSSRALPSISTAGRSQTPSEPPISATSTQQSQLSQLPNGSVSSQDLQAMLSSSGVEDALQHALTAAAGSTDPSGAPPPPIDPALMNLISQLPLDEIAANVPKQPATTHDNSADETISTATAKTPTRPRRSRKPSQNAKDDEDDDEDAPPPKKRARKKSTDGTTTPRKTTRRRKSVIASDDEDQDEGEEGTEVPVKAKKRKRAASGTPRTRKKRTPSLPPYDPAADPGEQIDPTIVTMASLCEDTGFGRVSSKAMEIQKNHVEWKQKNRQRMADMRAKSERKKYGLKDSDDEGETTKKEPLPAGVLTSVDKDAEGAAEEEEPGVIDETGQGFDYSQRLAANRSAVQIRIGPNGETIIDDDSLVVDRNENDATEHYTQITESDTSKFVNSSTYTKRLRGSRWSGEETDMFYDALMQYGENYELISMILPGRDRKACKNKFKAEDKRNPTRITFALKNKRPINIEQLSLITGKDFSGPVPEIAVPPPPNAAPPGEGDEALHQIKTSSSRPTTPAPQKKRSRKHKDAGDGVEIMGTVDDFLDEDEVLIELDKR